MTGNLLVGQSGGPTAVINASLGELGTVDVTFTGGTYSVDTTP